MEAHSGFIQYGFFGAPEAGILSLDHIGEDLIECSLALLRCTAHTSRLKPDHQHHASNNHEV
jgi:hypothetical protein